MAEAFERWRRSHRAQAIAAIETTPNDTPTPAPTATVLLLLAEDVGHVVDVEVAVEPVLVVLDVLETRFASAALPTIILPSLTTKGSPDEQAGWLLSDTMELQQY